MTSKKLQKIFFALVIGIAIILIRHYEWKQKIQRTPEISGMAQLVRVVDGDTIIVRINNEEERIRIIGIDTPESVQPNTPIECFGKEASGYTKELLKEISELNIETDPTQDTRDRNGRILAHVFVGGVNLGETLVRGGYAYEYTYNDPYKYQSKYKEAQKYAKDNAIGLWSPETCAGKR
jgi:micrococcal nuclease